MDSDKVYWHKYTSHYRDAFGRLAVPIEGIVEIGVLRSASIMWLREHFPNATIHGVDIVPQQDDWLVDDRIFYHQIDQADEARLADFFAGLRGKIQLIIDDGSHVPLHQAMALNHGFMALMPGGLYVLEDIHTSYHVIFNHLEMVKKIQIVALTLDEVLMKRNVLHSAIPLNSIALLLGMEHIRNLPGDLAEQELRKLSVNSYFNADQVAYLFENIKRSYLVRRNTLPDRCWSCRSTSYNYATLTCNCGAELFSPVDSMSHLIFKG